MKCYFSEDIAEVLSCSRFNEFDDYGFPVHRCSIFPCEKYNELIIQNIKIAPQKQPNKKIYLTLPPWARCWFRFTYRKGFYFMVGVVIGLLIFDIALR